MATREPVQLPVVGWREWVALPEFGIQRIKAKIDTGARTSSLHVVHLRRFARRDGDWVAFAVHPLQRSTRETIEVSVPVLEYRSIRSSSGMASLRPVVLTEIELLGRRWPIELTLANRDAMGFRMLLGREAVRSRFVVDPGRSWYAGRPERSMKRKRKKKKRTKKRTKTAATASRKVKKTRKKTRTKSSAGGPGRRRAPRPGDNP